MPVPPTKKFKHYRGDDFRYAFRLEEYVDPDDTDLGTQPINLTGWTAQIESDPDLGFTITPPDSTGVLTVDLPHEDTVDPEVDSIAFDVLLIDPSAFQRTFLKGIIALAEQVA